MKPIWSRQSTRKMKSDSGTSSNKSVLKLLTMMRPHMKKVILAAICVLLVNVSQLLKPYLLKLVIDDFLIYRKAQTFFYSVVSLGIGYFVTVALGGLFSFAQVNLINRAGQDIMRALRGKVFKTIQLLPLSYIDKSSSGRLITRATNDVEALSEMYTDVIINIFRDAFLLVGIVYTMVVLNLKLALISFLVVPFMFLLVILLKKKIKENFKRVKSLIGKINGFMSENLSGMRIIQIFRGEKEKKEEFLELNNGYFKATLFQVRLNSLMRPAADIFQNLALSILIWYAMGGIANHTLEIGVLFAFTTYIKQFFAPISSLADNYTTIQSALVSAERISELLDQERSLENLDEGLALDRIKGDIEFKNVWFAYDNEDWVLKDVSFKLEKGRTTAFIGETGAGKTTIISLISGFYKIQKGQILIDGMDIETISKRDLRRNISVVLQDVFLFSGTIRSNIILNDDIGSEAVYDALRSSCALGFVQSLPGGIDEPVTERGGTLSAGQRQLLSFARAIAHDPSVLVLDEATSNIDTHTEKLLQKAIENASQGRTTLIIAHRLSTIRNADTIIVMKDGKISEMGSHAELLELDGYYVRMLTHNITAP